MAWCGTASTPRWAVLQPIRMASMQREDAPQPGTAESSGSACRVIVNSNQVDKLTLLNAIDVLY